MRPRLGFIGLGWVGQTRLRSVVRAGAATPAVYLEPDAENLSNACHIAAADSVHDMDELLDAQLDGVVIASPNRLHAEQARAAAEHGLPVFCQKPLAPRHREAEAVVAAAESSNVHLSVDWSYRGTRALTAVKEALHEGAIGDCYRAELTFHNSYGPGPQWYRDPAIAGGGCLLDLGCHLLDALQWLLPDQRFNVQSADMYQDGRRIAPGRIEEHAILGLRGEDVTASVQSSWNVPSGGDADVRIHLFGTRGGLRFSNVDGSFYDFRAERLSGATSQSLVEPPDLWRGRQILDWVGCLDEDTGFRKDTWHVVENARLLEEAYTCAS